MVTVSLLKLCILFIFLKINYCQIYDKPTNDDEELINYDNAELISHDEEPIIHVEESTHHDEELMNQEIEEQIGLSASQSIWFGDEESSEIDLDEESNEIDLEEESNEIYLDEEETDNDWKLKSYAPSNRITFRYIDWLIDNHKITPYASNHLIEPPIPATFPHIFCVKKKSNNGIQFVPANTDLFLLPNVWIWDPVSQFNLPYPICPTCGEVNCIFFFLFFFSFFRYQIF